MAPAFVFYAFILKVLTLEQALGGKCVVNDVERDKSRRDLAARYRMNLPIKVDDEIPSVTFFDDEETRASALCEAMADPVPCKAAVSREMQVADLKLYFEAVTDLGAFLEKRGTNLRTDIEGHSANYLKKVQTFRKLARDPSIRNICEIGFNAGHSALNWLSSSPHTSVFAFGESHLANHRHPPFLLQYGRYWPSCIHGTWIRIFKVLTLLSN
jgi:hypothetical protein